MCILEWSNWKWSTRRKKKTFGFFVSLEVEKKIIIYTTRFVGRYVSVWFFFYIFCVLERIYIFRSGGTNHCCCYTSPRFPWHIPNISLCRLQNTLFSTANNNKNFLKGTQKIIFSFIMSHIKKINYYFVSEVYELLHE